MPTQTLLSKDCIPCRGGTPPLKGADIDHLFAQLGNNWQVIDQHHLEKSFAFSNFRDALDLTIRIGELAETQGHHPDIHLAWGRVKVQIWTHKINGLTESDFIFAAKSDACL